MKNYEIENMCNSLNSAVLTESSREYPIKVLSAKFKNVRVLGPYYTDFMKLRDELIMKYGQPSEEGGYIVNTSDEAFKAEYEELLNINHDELDAMIVKIPESELGDIKMSPAEFDVLSCMISFD